MCVFAAVWWVIGLSAGGAAPALYSVAVIISAALIVVALRRPGEAASRIDRKHIGRVVGIASTIEGLLILLAAIVLANLDASDLLIPIIAIIVGAHFIPLARWLPAPLYYWTGAVLIALGAIGIWLPAAQRGIAVGVGAACILWVTTLIVLLRPRRT